MVYVLKFSDVLNRCQREIADVIGKHLASSMKDKSPMLYAVDRILENRENVQYYPIWCRY